MAFSSCRGGERVDALWADKLDEEDDAGDSDPQDVLTDPAVAEVLTLRDEEVAERQAAEEVCDEPGTDADRDRVGQQELLERSRVAGEHAGQECRPCAEAQKDHRPVGAAPGVLARETPPAWGGSLHKPEEGMHTHLEQRQPKDRPEPGVEGFIKKHDELHSSFSSRAGMFMPAKKMSPPRTVVIATGSQYVPIRLPMHAPSTTANAHIDANTCQGGSSFS